MQGQCQTDHRRRRLHQILERESGKAPVLNALRVSKSLPSLILEQPQLPSVSCQSPVLIKSTPNLSPLRTQCMRPPTQQLTVRQDKVPFVNGSIDSVPSQIAHEAVLAKHADDWEKRRSCMVARQYKAAQLEQIHDKQHRRCDRKLEAQHISEHIEWEHTQLDLVEQSHRRDRQAQLQDLRASHVQSVDLERRQAHAAKLTQYFVDRLAVMEPSQAMDLFVAKHDELVVGSMDLLAECVERHELEHFKEILLEKLQKEEARLRHRLRAAQREEDVKATAKRAVANLKRAQYDEIQQHITTSHQNKAEQRLLRNELVHQQHLLDTRYRALQDRKKHRDLEMGMKLQDQMRQNRAEQATVSLHIGGAASPVLRTPFWRNESTEECADTYEQLPPSTTSPVRPTIFAKKACQWYD